MPDTSLLTMWIWFLKIGTGKYGIYHYHHSHDHHQYYEYKSNKSHLHMQRFFSSYTSLHSQNHYFYTEKVKKWSRTTKNLFLWKVGRYAKPIKFFSWLVGSHHVLLPVFCFLHFLWIHYTCSDSHLKKLSLSLFSFLVKCPVPIFFYRVHRYSKSGNLVCWEVKLTQLT